MRLSSHVAACHEPAGRCATRVSVPEAAVQLPPQGTDSVNSFQSLKESYLAQGPRRCVYGHVSCFAKLWCFCSMLRIFGYECLTSECRKLFPWAKVAMWLCSDGIGTRADVAPLQKIVNDSGQWHGQWSFAFRRACSVCGGTIDLSTLVVLLGSPPFVPCS